MAPASIVTCCVTMAADHGDRDWFLLGTIVVDLGSDAASRRVSPYLVAGAGLMHHLFGVGVGRFSTVEGAATGGGGLRVRLTERVDPTTELRLGWEPHLRWTTGVAWRLR